MARARPAFARSMCRSAGRRAEPDAAAGSRGSRRCPCRRRRSARAPPADVELRAHRHLRLRRLQRPPEPPRYSRVRRAQPEPARAMRFDDVERVPRRPRRCPIDVLVAPAGARGASATSASVHLGRARRVELRRVVEHRRLGAAPRPRRRVARREPVARRVGSSASLRKAARMGGDAVRGSRSRATTTTAIISRSNFVSPESPFMATSYQAFQAIQVRTGAASARASHGSFRQELLNLGLAADEAPRASAHGAAGLTLDRHRHGEIEVDGQPLRPDRCRSSRAAGGRRPGAVDSASGDAMIVRDAGDAWQVVLQTDHADLSGAFARAWAERGAGHDSLVIAAERHDDGWAVWERAPRVDESGQARQLPRRRRPLAPRVLPRRDRRDHRAGRRRRAARVDARRRHLPAALRAGPRPRAHPRRRGARSSSRRSSPSRRRSSAATAAGRRAALGRLRAAPALRPALAATSACATSTAGEAAELQGYRLEPLAPWRVRPRRIRSARARRASRSCGG